MSREALDAAIRQHHTSEDPDAGPVVAWVTIAALDNNGDEETDVLWITTPPGQRGFVTTGLLHSAIDIDRQDPDL